MQNYLSQSIICLYIYSILINKFNNILIEKLILIIIIGSQHILSRIISLSKIQYYIIFYFILELFTQTLV